MGLGRDSPADYIGEHRELLYGVPAANATAFCAYSYPQNASRRKKFCFIFSQVQQYELLIQQ